MKKYIELRSILNCLMRLLHALVVESMSRVRCIVMHGLARLSSMLISAIRASARKTSW